jgi:hypothetical protein
MRMLARDAALPISTAYRYLHEGIDVLAAQAPDLHQVLRRAQAEGSDYRRPLATFAGTIATVIGLHFYAMA